MRDLLTIHDYRNFLADKLRLISELAVAICGDDDPDNPASIGFLIETVKDQTRKLETTQAENDRLRKALENLSVAHIETETEFSRTIKNYSRGILSKRPFADYKFPPLDPSSALN